MYHTMYLMKLITFHTWLMCTLWKYKYVIACESHRMGMVYWKKDMVDLAVNINQIYLHHRNSFIVYCVKCMAQFIFYQWLQLTSNVKVDIFNTM